MQIIRRNIASTTIKYAYGLSSYTLPIIRYLGKPFSHALAYG